MPRLSSKSKAEQYNSARELFDACLRQADGATQSQEAAPINTRRALLELTARVIAEEIESIAGDTTGLPDADVASSRITVNDLDNVITSMAAVVQSMADAGAVLTNDPLRAQNLGTYLTAIMAQQFVSGFTGLSETKTPSIDDSVAQVGGLESDSIPPTDSVAPTDVEFIGDIDKSGAPVEAEAEAVDGVVLSDVPSASALGMQPN